MKSFKLLVIIFSVFFFLSASSYDEVSNGFESCQETVTVIYEHENSCGGISGFYYIQNGGGICGNNYFQTLKVPCKKPVPAPDNPF